ncbi:MAG: peptidoglycan DD-metalloendopeptidase family protein [Woeseiaceae bacterium]
MTTRTTLVLLALLIAVSDSAVAQELYKYQDADGNWIYSDRPPDDGQAVESQELEQAAAEDDDLVDVTSSMLGRSVLITARNDYFAPVEIRLEITESNELELPPADHVMTWILEPRSEMNLLQLRLTDNASQPVLEYQFRYLQGDPRAEHNATETYRAPFAISSDHRITQAYPDTKTHSGPDSYHAVDIDMPVGTDVIAARDGIVFDIASKNYRTGQDADVDGPAANVVRILHDDGTYAIYAHLNTNTIRVKPGDFVERGQYIADSGNTGFSTGPHLHFAVVQNAGMRVQSVPVTFTGPRDEAVVPASGEILVAY